MIHVEKIDHLKGHKAAVFTLQQGSAPETVLSGSGDGFVVEWHLGKASDPRAIARIPTNIFAICPLPDKDKIAIGQMYGGLHFIDLQTNTEEKFFQLGRKGVFDLRYRAQDEILYATAPNGSLYVFKLQDTPELLSEIPLGKDTLRSLSLSPDGRHLAAGCSDDIIYVYEVETGSLKHRLKGHENSVFSVCYHPAGHELVSGSRDAQLKIWSVNDDYQLLRSIPAHLSTVNHICFHPEEALMATASRDKTIKIWDALDYRLLKVIDQQKFETHTHSVNKLFWSSYRNYLISCSDDRSLIVWKVDHPPTSTE